MRKLIWHIFPANLLVTAGSLLAILWYGSSALESFYIDWLAEDLRARAALVEDRVTELLADGREQELDALCRRLGRASDTRITVISPDGRVVADSHEDPGRMENHADRPEVRSARSGLAGTILRPSPTLQIGMLYVAVPLSGLGSETGKNGGTGVPVLRLARPASAIDRALLSLRLRVGVSGLVVGLFAALATIVVSRRISKPLETMTRGARQLAREDFTVPLAVSESCSREVGELAAALNTMARTLRDRFDTIVRQRNELQTILASMAEAIVVIDEHRKIVTINSSACTLLKTDAENARGRKIGQVIRHVTLEKLVDLTLVGREIVTGELTLDTGGERHFLQYSGVRLVDDEDQVSGAVMVLNDVTHIRRLEHLRRDFVANVSHELMTPLTSIRGYAETILDSPDQDRRQIEEFVNIILRQSDRLQAIVRDLLSLSRIEKEIEEGEIQPVMTRVCGVLEEAVQVCRPKAGEKEIGLQLDCPPDLTAPLDVPLMTRAVVNLLVNAVKYSESAGRVELRAERRVGEDGERLVAITVRDYGPGIGAEHLPRLFERFYRSDKARSRQLGGTGLGLAIVKHIVQAHQGSVEVASEVGRGTRFTILVPAAPEEEC